MNYSSVFRKSEIGRDEIKYHSLGVLPREARTLLIMIDGKRTYQNYLDTLDNSKIFVEFGGVTPLFELLLELGCIEVVGKVKEEQGYSQSPSYQANNQWLPPSNTTAKANDKSSEAEFDETFNRQQSEAAVIDSVSKSNSSHASYELIKSDLASYIENNAPPEQAWGYLLSLEQCNDPSQLLMLIREIQNANDANLSSGMTAFASRISA